MVIFMGTYDLARAQATPNCNQNSQILTLAGVGASYNNSTIKCSVWKLNYFSTGFTVISIQLEGAPDNGNGAPGAWAIIPTTVTNGTNPLTSTVSGTLSVNAYFPWMRANLTTATGSGAVNVSLIGNAYVGDASSITSGASTVPSNVIASGPDAIGVSPTKNPLFIAGPRASNGAIQGFQNDFNAGSGNGSMVVSFLQGGTPADALTNSLCCTSAKNSATGVPLMVNNMGGYNGTTWDRYRNSSLANSFLSTARTAINSIGAAQSEKGARWSVFSNPAASSQATASIAAEASVRHVVDCIAFSAASTTAPALTALAVNVRDGATGAGTVIWTYQTAISAVTGQNVAPFSVCGLNLVGTTNTAMTLEFQALLTNLIESVSISGYNVN
jgi:hypothetical protein